LVMALEEEFLYQLAPSRLDYIKNTIQVPFYHTPLIRGHKAAPCDRHGRIQLLPPSL
jgi:hypothetical protein